MCFGFQRRPQSPLRMPMWWTTAAATATATTTTTTTWFSTIANASRSLCFLCCSQNPSIYLSSVGSGWSEVTAEELLLLISQVTSRISNGTHESLTKLRNDFATDLLGEIGKNKSSNKVSYLETTLTHSNLSLKKKTVHLDVGHSQSGIVSFCCNHDIARASHVPISKLSKLPQLHHNFRPADALGVKLTLRPSFVRPEMLGFTTKELEEAGTWKRKVWRAPSSTMRHFIGRIFGASEMMRLRNLRRGRCPSRHRLPRRRTWSTCRSQLFMHEHTHRWTSTAWTTGMAPAHTKHTTAMHQHP